MMSMPELATLLGWCTLLNGALLLMATLFLALWPDMPRRLHSRWFQVGEEQLGIIYFQYLATYKLGILLLNLVPYVALKLMLAN